MRANVALLSRPPQALEAEAAAAVKQARASRSARATVAYPKLNVTFANLFLLGSPLSQ